MVACTQNGVHSAERIEPVIGPGRIIPFVNYVNSIIEKSGVISVKFAGITSFGELDGGMTPRIDLLIKSFKRAGIDVEFRQDIRTYLWEKYAAFCGFAAVEVLTRLPAGTIRECPETNDMWVRALREVMEVAKAVGVALSDGFLGFTHLPQSYRVSTSLTSVKKCQIPRPLPPRVTGP